MAGPALTLVFLQLVFQLMKTLMASTDEVNQEEVAEEPEQPGIDTDSKDYQRNAAEFNAIIQQEKESVNQLSQATGKR